MEAIPLEGSVKTCWLWSKTTTMFHPHCWEYICSARLNALRSGFSHFSPPSILIPTAVPFLSSISRLPSPVHSSLSKLYHKVLPGDWHVFQKCLCSIGRKGLGEKTDVTCGAAHMWSGCYDNNPWDPRPVNIFPFLIWKPPVPLRGQSSPVQSKIFRPGHGPEIDVASSSNIYHSYLILI